MMYHVADYSTPLAALRELAHTASLTNDGSLMPAFVVAALCVVVALRQLWGRPRS